MSRTELLPAEERIIWETDRFLWLASPSDGLGDGELSTLLSEAHVPGSHICALNMFRIRELKEK